MWIKKDDEIRDEHTATDDVVMARLLSYDNDSQDSLAIRNVNIFRWSGENRWIISINARSRQAFARFKDILGCQLYSPGSSGAGCAVHSPDMRVVATIFSRLVIADPSFQAVCLDVFEKLNINYNDVFEQIPNWFLYDDNYIDGSLRYLSTRPNIDIYSSIEIKFSDTTAKVVFERNDRERTSIQFSKQGFADSRSAFRLCLGENKISESIADEMFDKIAERFGRTVTQASSSTVNAVRFSSPTPLKTKEDLELTLSRLSNLINGVRTVKSNEMIGKLSKDLMGSHWIKDNPKIKNINDLYFSIKQQRFFKDFMFNYRDKVKKELIYLLHDFISSIEDFDTDKLLNDDMTEVTRLRKSLTEKRGELPNYIDLALMILAKYWPINTEEPVSLESIEQIENKNRIFVTTGQHLDLASLVAFHEARVLKQDETINNKDLINPATNKAITRLNANAIYSIAKFRDDLKPNSLPDQDNILMERLYDLKTLKTLRSIDPRIWQTPLNEHMRRISHLDKTDAMRLSRNVLKYTSRDPEMIENSKQNRFAIGLAQLLHYGLSIEAFAPLDNESQVVLAFGRSFSHMMGYGINTEKLLSLSAEGLKAIDEWVYRQDYPELPETEFPFFKLSGKDRMAIEEKIDELLSNDNSFTNKLSVT